MMAAKKSKDRVDCVIALLDEHMNDHSFLLDILSDHFAGNRKSFQQRIGRIRRSPFGQFLGSLNARRVLALWFGEPLYEFFNLFRRWCLIALEKIEHGLFL